MTLAEYIPASLQAGPDAEVHIWSLTLSRQDEQLRALSFTVTIPDWTMSDVLSLTVKNPYLTCEVAVPHNPENDTRFIEGALYSHDQALPVMKVSLPFVDLDDREIQMTDSEYPITGFGQLSGILGGFDLTAALPPGIQHPSGLSLTELYICAPAGFGGFYCLTLGAAALRDGQSSWEILPGVLTMRNISMEVGIPPSTIGLSGIVDLGPAELFATARIVLEDGTAPSSVSVELDGGASENDAAVSLTDLSGIVVDLPAMLPGLNALDLQLYGLRIDMEIGTSLELTQFNCTIGSPSYWGPVHGFVLGNFSVEMNYIKALDGAENKSFEAIVQGELKHGETGTFSFPIELTIPTTGSWMLELGEQDGSEGIKLPGLNDLAGIAGIDILQHIPTIVDIDDIYLTGFSIQFTPARGSFDSLFMSMYMPQLLSIGPLQLNDMAFMMFVEYMDAENAVKAAISCSIELGAIKIPVYLPLPLNSEEWTVRLYDTAKIPSLSYFLDILGFDATNWLSELFGLIGIPEMSISVLNLKFNVSPFDLKKAEIKAEFTGGISLNLPPGHRDQDGQPGILHGEIIGKPER